MEYLHMRLLATELLPIENKLIKAIECEVIVIGQWFSRLCDDQQQLTLKLDDQSIAHRDCVRKSVQTPVTPAERFVR